MNLDIYDILIIAFVVLALLGMGLYFLNRWVAKRNVENNEAIEKTRQSADIFVIDKKMGKLSEANLPKVAMQQVPKIYKIMKTPLVKAKIGPQVITLMCDRRIFKALPVKKTVKVDLAGMYIVGMKGMKSQTEYKKQVREKKEKAKQTVGSKKGK